MNTTRIDFARTGPRLTSWGLRLVLLGLLSLTLVIGFYWRSHRQHQQATNAMDDARARLARQDAQRQSLQRASDLLERQRQEPRWVRARQDMKYPWHQTLAAIEASARPPAYLLALRMDTAQHSLELEAVAPAFDGALNVLGAMSRQPVIRDAALVSREGPAGTNAAGVADLRFAIKAKWAQP